MPVHRTERQREPGVYGSRLPRLGWTCQLCGRWWTREPRSWCPGVPMYDDWNEAAKAGLHTVTQWRAERRVVVQLATPAAAMYRGAAKPNDWYWLYKLDQTRPMRAAPATSETGAPDAPAIE